MADKGGIAVKDIRVAVTGSLLKEVLVVLLRPEEDTSQHQA